MTETKHQIGVITLTLITAALFLTLRNMPMMAQTGMKMVVFNAITIVVYLIPVALVSAELATGWPKNGVFHWVEAAFGSRAGFLAVWLQWAQSIFGITSIVAYVAASLAYALDPALGANKYFIVAVILVVYWGATLANFHGSKSSGIISSVAVSIGVLLPTTVLIILGLAYARSGNPLQIDTALTLKNWVPSISETGNLTLFLSFIFGFVGVEVSASHAREVKNVHRTYPLAVFSAAFIGFVLTLLGGLAVAAILPVASIDQINGAMQAFSAFFEHFGLVWLTPIAAVLVALGAAGQVSTWIVGPVKGILAAGQAGYLPTWAQKVNGKGVPTNLLIVQALLISLIAMSFLLVDDVNTAFLILTSIAVLIYSLMYVLMYAAAIRLRYTHPEVPRAYRVPGGNAGMWITAGLGLLAALACFAIGFIPPAVGALSTLSFELMMAIGVLLVSSAPLLIYAARRPGWVSKGALQATTKEES
ncbi:amino acid permease [Ruegeria sp. 2205SS24-7]|uniref:amino acid permease n=1 Tax=Ruegeria discodermiae TaxID=3064389 RepID=UPI0027408800|nr:amino acid permease [Ruegeria sp. 2205SS24-7]MDP5220158.1 amino acid permease [Ruegeria sp. 2205SS24-7]